MMMWTPWWYELLDDANTLIMWMWTLYWCWCELLCNVDKNSLKMWMMDSLMKWTFWWWCELFDDVDNGLLDNVNSLMLIWTSWWWYGLHNIDYMYYLCGLFGDVDKVNCLMVIWWWFGQPLDDDMDEVNFLMMTWTLGWYDDNDVDSLMMRTL